MSAFVGMCVLQHAVYLHSVVLSHTALIKWRSGIWSPERKPG